MLLTITEHIPKILFALPLLLSWNPHERKKKKNRFGLKGHLLNFLIMIVKLFNYYITHIPISYILK